MNYENRNETLDEGEEEMNTMQQGQPQQNDENFVYEICQLFDKDNDEHIYVKDFLEKTKEEDKISFEEFFGLYDLLNQHRKPKEEEEQELLQAFSFFDGKNRGFIGTSYFKKVITRLGDKISEEDFNNLIQQVIMDNTNKKFDYRDLIQIILGLKK